ncbi:MAG: ATP-binding cassette domain-containing protein [Methanospirillum sp.]
MTPALEARGIRFSYPNGHDALRDVSIAIEVGDKVALVGPNGAGKSTLLLMANGLLRPTAGEMRLHGEPFRYDRRHLREIRRRVGLVIQNSDAQLFAPTVYQDVAFGPLNLGLSEEEVRQAVAGALAAVGLRGFESRPPHLLSGGEKKAVAIAGVLAMRPEVLVFDEPTSALDPASALVVMELLDELNASGTTIVVSTHDVELAYAWADRVVLMDGGRVLHQGRPDEVFLDDALVRTAKLRLPVVLEVHAELAARGLVRSGEPPRSVLHLVHALDTNRPAGGHGAILLIDAGRVRADDLDRFCRAPGVHVGAMGTAAKALAEREKVRLEFASGVIDRCLLKALLGEDSVILCSTAMLGHVRNRVAEFEIRTGLSVDVRSPLGAA